MLFITSWKGHDRGIGQICSKMDQAPQIAFSAPHSHARRGLGWDLGSVGSIPSRLPSPACGKSNLPHSQPAPARGQKVIVHKQRSKTSKEKFSRLLRVISWGADHQGGGSVGPWERLVCSLGAVLPVQAFQKQVSRVNPHALGFFGGTWGCLCLVEHLGNQEIRSHLGCSGEIGVT